MVPMSTPAAVTRLLLAPEGRPQPLARDTSAARVRRYRLARLRLDAGRHDAAPRYDYLKRSHD